MALTRAKILKDLDHQEAAEGASADIELLRSVLDFSPTSMQWQMLTKVSHVRYGKLSYQVRMHWRPSQLLRNLAAYQSAPRSSDDGLSSDQASGAAAGVQ